jgi:hypothetical protein
MAKKMKWKLWQKVLVAAIGVGAVVALMPEDEFDDAVQDLIGEFSELLGETRETIGKPDTTEEG